MKKEIIKAGALYKQIATNRESNYKLMQHAKKSYELQV